MAKTQILGLPLTDFLGADKKKSVAETMSTLMGLSPDSAMNLLDKAYELLKNDITIINQKEDIVSVSATHSTTSDTEDFYIATAAITAYKDKSTYLLAFDTSNTTKVTININNIGFLYLKKINDVGEVVDVIAGDIKLNVRYLYQLQLASKQLVLIGEDFNSHINNTNNPHEVTQEQVGLSSLTNDAQVKRSEMGAVDGVATLDEDGTIPATQLPHCVYDVFEFELKSELPTVGTSGKIYIVFGDIKANNGTYRWDGIGYVMISNPLDIATKVEALNGSDNTKIMTPLRVKESIEHNIPLDNATITKVDDILAAIAILESNKNVVNKFWCGTKAEYLALGDMVSDDTTYIVTDEI